MAYERLNLKQNDLIDEEVFKKIDDGIEIIHNDLYDNKTTGGELVEYFNTWSSPTSGGISYSTTFAGWTGYVGTVKDITHVKFKFKVVSGYPVSMICIKFWELPDKSAMTPNANGLGYTPNINTWNNISTTVKSFEAVTDSSMYTEKTIELDVPIHNNEKQLVMGIDFNNIVTYPMLRLDASQFPNDMPAFGVVTSSTRTPDYENLTEAMIKNTTWNQTTGILSATDFNFDSPLKVIAPTCILYNLEGATPYSEIGTQDEDKFSELVKEVLSNSGIQTNIDLATSMVTSNFEPVVENSYYKGTQNLDNSQLSQNSSLTSTFCGFLWSIGKLPADIMLTGFKTIVKCRNNAGTYTTCDKIWGYLYESDVRPDTPSNGGDRLHVGTTATQVRVVEIDVNLDVASEESAVVEFIFDKPYYNTEEKYIYIGYNMNVNGHLMGCYSYTAPQSTLTAIDGTSYGTCYNYQTTTKTQLGRTQDWGNGWSISNASPWHLLKGEEKWYAAEGLREIIENATDNLDLTVPATAEVCLPKKYDLVVGDTFQMFYRGVIKCFDINAQGINVLCSVGSAYPRYFEYTPTTTGEYPLTIQCRDIEGTVIASGTTTLVVHAVPTYSSPKTVNMMIFGDSLTASGMWPAEGIRRLVGTSDDAKGPASLKVSNLTINTYGAIENTVNTHTVRHEGYGGWAWTSFMDTERTGSTVNGIYVTLSSAHGYDLNTVQKSVWTDNNGKKWELEDFPANNKIKFNRGEGNNATQANTSLPTSLSCASLSLSLSGFTVTWESGNPFYDVNSGKVDFAHHANKYGYESADIAACLLSWNLGGGTADGSFNFTERIENIIENQAKPLIRQLHSDMPNTKLIVMGLQLNSITGGMAANYGATGGSGGGYGDAWGSMMFAFDYDKALEDMCNESEFKSYCYYADTKGQFDTEYMMPWEEHAVNTRLSTRKEIRGLNGVHPSGDGYYQIGDAFFRKLVAVLNDIK